MVLFFSSSYFAREIDALKAKAEETDTLRREVILLKSEMRRMTRKMTRMKRKEMIQQRHDGIIIIHILDNYQRGSFRMGNGRGQYYLCIHHINNQTLSNILVKMKSLQ